MAMRWWLATLTMLLFPSSAQRVASRPDAAASDATVQLRAWEVDRQASAVFVVTHRAGVLGFLGHEHALIPATWSSRLCLDSPVPAGANGVIHIDAASLVIDSDSARGLAGLGGGPGAGDLRTIRRKLGDERHLDFARYPAIEVRAVAVGAESSGKVAGRVTLMLHGVTRDLPVELQVDRAGEALTLTGRLRIRQTDFGIRPESIAGVVRVRDEVDLVFRLVAHPAGAAC